MRNIMSKMTKAELEAKVASLEAEKAQHATTAGHGTIRKPVAGFLNQHDVKPRVSIILTSAQVDALQSEVSQGHVGLTISFTKAGSSFITTTPYISTFNGARQFGVTLPSMHKLMQDNINFSAGNMADLHEEAHA
jgi:hypothetical protein